MRWTESVNDGRDSLAIAARAWHRHKRIVSTGAIVTSDPLPVVAAQDAHLLQLLQNLIGNALKYRAAAPRIHISAERQQAAWLIRVSDNGVGLDRHYSEVIFKPFKRGQCHGRVLKTSRSSGQCEARLVAEVLAEFLGAPDDFHEFIEVRLQPFFLFEDERLFDPGPRMRFDRLAEREDFSQMLRIDSDKLLRLRELHLRVLHDGGQDDLAQAFPVRRNFLAAAIARPENIEDSLLEGPDRRVDERSVS